MALRVEMVVNRSMDSNLHLGAIANVSPNAFGPPVSYGFQPQTSYESGSNRNGPFNGKYQYRVRAADLPHFEAKVPDIHHKRQADDLWARLKVAKWAAFCHSARLGRRPAQLKPVSSDKASCVNDVNRSRSI